MLRAATVAAADISRSGRYLHPWGLEKKISKPRVANLRWWKGEVLGSKKNEGQVWIM